MFFQRLLDVFCLQGLFTAAVAQIGYCSLMKRLKLPAQHDFAGNCQLQVIAQFGKSSDQVQSLGLKKKIEYKRPSRRVKAIK
jgi:hypothetical protein